MSLIVRGLLAHVVLFDHDRRMLRLVGKDAYARWMDDQAFGVQSRADGLRILNSCGDSLSRLHLTANASKSRILTLAEAERHFHFTANDGIDRIVKYLDDQKDGVSRGSRLMFALCWRNARHGEFQGGEWPKVLKRMYLVAARVGATFLRPRAMRDILKYPTLAARVADYMAGTGGAAQYLEFVNAVWCAPEQVYPDVNVALAEGLVQIEAKGSAVSKIRCTARELLRGRQRFPGWEACAALAPLSDPSIRRPAIATNAPARHHQAPYFASGHRKSCCRGLCFIRAQGVPRSSRRGK